MSRELPRTVKTLQAQYQEDIKEDEIEIIVVDNGSEKLPVLPDNVKIISIKNPNFSPSKSVNIGISEAKGNLIGVFVDGARMASPGIYKYALKCLKLSSKPIIATLGFHLGPNIQKKSMENGYNQEKEDHLLNKVNWESNGYSLFEISSFAGSSRNGWFSNIGESNALFMTRSMWNELDGYDENFKTPGGGLVNLDIYKRALDLKDSQLFILLGEGTFHQIHNGISTNQKREDASFKVFNEEYKSIRKKDFIKLMQKPILFGSFSKCHSNSLKESLLGLNQM